MRPLIVLPVLALALAACHPQAAAPANAVALEQRIAKLEQLVAHYAEALDFLNKVYAQQKEQTAQQEADEPAEDAVFAVDIAEDLALGQVDGPPTALVTVIKAFDFACPYCQRTADTMDELVKDYAGKVRVVYKSMIIHPDVATPAHLASCAAAKQGKYLAFKKQVWDKGFLAYASAHDPSKLGKDNLVAIAKSVGLDTGKLQTDMASDACKQVVANDMAELEKFHVTGTPTFFINGRILSGALPKDGFKEMIDERLKVAEASGVPGADYYAKEVMGKGEKKFRSKVDPKPR